MTPFTQECVWRTYVLRTYLKDISCIVFLCLRSFMVEKRLCFIQRNNVKLNYIINTYSFDQLVAKCLLQREKNRTLHIQKLRVKRIFISFFIQNGLKVYIYIQVKSDGRLNVDCRRKNIKYIKNFCKSVEHSSWTCLLDTQWILS